MRALAEGRVRSILALLVFLALWLDGKFYPLILLPLLFTTFYDRRSLSSIGVGARRLGLSLGLGAGAGMLLVAAYYPIFLHYLGRRSASPLEMGVIFTDLIWFPLYEEVSYRGFFLGVYARRDGATSRFNLALNLVQTLLFVSVHHHHVSAGLPFLLIPVFVLAFLNGLVFLASRNIAGCVLGHALVNGVALLLQSVSAGGVPG